MNGFSVDSELKLSEEHRRQANNLSHFDAGDAIVEGAQRTYQQFFKEFHLEDCECSEQREYLEERAVAWHSLTTQCFNDQLARRAEFVPVNVAGPARYDVVKHGKTADRNMEKTADDADKMDKFTQNTRNGLKQRRPIQSTLDGLRNGKFHKEVITSNDPHAMEKLQAKLDYLEEKQAQMKQMNAYWRKHETFMGYDGLSDEEARSMDVRVKSGGRSQKPYATYQLTNNNQQIKAIRNRMKDLETHKEEDIFETVAFTGGSVSVDKEIDRLQFFFDGKPDEATRHIMKRNGFRWAPSQGAWQRQWTANAERSVKAALKELEELEEQNGQ